MQSWKQKVQHIKRALKRQRLNVFRIATNLAAIHEDPEFMASETIAGDHGKAIAFLNEYAAQALVVLTPSRDPYNDLRALLEMYPKEADWQGNKLTDMYQALLDRVEAKKEPASSRRRRTATIAELEELEEANEKLRRENTELHQRVAELQGEVQRLREQLRERSEAQLEPALA